MLQNQLSFESERLVVHYLSFNITGCKDPGRIAIYLSDSFGFNSIVKETFQGKSEDLIFKITKRVPRWRRSHLGRAVRVDAGRGLPSAVRSLWF